MIVLKCTVCGVATEVHPSMSMGDLVGRAQTFAHQHKDCGK